MRRLRAGMLAVLAAAACGGQTGPREGDITLVLATARTETGALLLRLVGPGGQVTPLAGLRAGTAPLGNAATRIVLTGSIVSGDIIRVRIPDIELAESYSVVVEQAALGTTFALVDPGDFTVSVRR